MKQLVCDFCDSIRLGTKIGYKAFKKEFESAREIRKVAKASNFLSGEVYKVNDATMEQDMMIKDIRSLAQKNYVESDPLSGKSEKAMEKAFDKVSE